MIELLLLGLIVWAIWIVFPMLIRVTVLAVVIFMAVAALALSPVLSIIVVAVAIYFWKHPGKGDGGEDALCQP